VLTVTTVASLIKSKRDPDAKAHAGSLRNHPDQDRAAGS
jgi:tellurite resistance protein TerC